MACKYSKLVLYNLVLLLIAIDESESVNVQKISDGEITTFLKNTSLKGIPFKKREINGSVYATVSFKISDTSTAQDYSRTWNANGVDITNSIVVYGSNAPSPPHDIYTTETVVADGSSLDIVLHLRHNHLVPGEYRLTVAPPQDTPSSAVATISSAPILPLFEKVRKVLDGDRLAITCEVTGFPLPDKVTWTFYYIKPEFIHDPTSMPKLLENPTVLDDSSTDYTFVTNKVTDDQLVFEKLPANYSGLFVCSVENNKGERDESYILVNIKDRWAALWPFIGIVVEVIVVVSGILLYERHQMRSTRAAKNDSTAATAAADLSPKSAAEAANVLPPHQNNMSAVGDPHVDALPDGNKTGNGETGDDVRLRNAPQC